MKENDKSNTNYLTSIRGAACLVVVIAHILANIPSVGVNVSGCGKIGVWLFFVLSALLLTTQWLKKDTITFKDILEFYIKRIFRIFPCYIFVLLLSLAIGYIPTFSIFIKHIFLLEGYGHFWTIPVEFKFYLLVPIFILIINKLKDSKKSIIFLFVLLIISSIVWPYTKYIENSINLKWYIPVFFMGMIMSFFYLKFSKSKKTTAICDLIFCAIIIGILISVPYIRNLIFKIAPDRYLQNKYLYFGFAWCIAIIAIQNSKHIIKLLNNSKFLLFVGNISFPLYLVHYVLLNKIQINNLVLKYTFVIIISFAFAIIMNNFIEKKMINLSKNINNKLRKK